MYKRYETENKQILDDTAPENNGHNDSNDHLETSTVNVSRLTCRLN